MKTNDVQRSIDTMLSGMTVSDARKAELLRGALGSMAPKSTRPATPKMKLRFSLSLPLPHMVVAAIVVVIVMVAPLFVSERPADFRTWQSEDGEHYMVQGMGKGQNGDAGADNIPTEYGVFDCPTLEDVQKYYGRIPPMPTWLPDGATWLTANVGATSRSRNLSAIYLYNESTLLYTVYESYDGRTYTAVEQSEEGEFVTLSTGQEVYITRNIDYLTIFWTNDSIEYMISGLITREEAIRMAESVAIY